MTARLPLVQAGGQVQQLQAGDTLAGVSSGGSVPTTMRATFTIPADTQALFRQQILVGSFSIVMAADSSLIGV